MIFFTYLAEVCRQRVTGSIPSEDNQNIGTRSLGTVAHAGGDGGKQKRWR